MTRHEAINFINDLVALRTSATDEQAIGAIATYPAWKSGYDYAIGDRVVYNNTLYKVLTAHTAQPDWEPSVATSLFAKVLIPNAKVIPDWEQPDSTNPYMQGDTVMFNGKTWVSVVDNNVWVPDVYGWEEI